MNVITFHDIPVATVLAKAQAAKLTQVLVMGYEADGTLYVACSTGDEDLILDLILEAQDEIQSSIREHDEVEMDLVLQITDADSLKLDLD